LRALSTAPKSLLSLVEWALGTTTGASENAHFLAHSQKGVTKQCSVGLPKHPRAAWLKARKPERARRLAAWNQENS